MPTPAAPLHSLLRPLRLAACTALLAAGLAAPSLHAVGGRTVLDDGHLDLTFDYTSAGWTTAVIHDDFGLSFAFDQVLLHFNSAPFPEGHLVPARPTGATWDFLGVAANEPFWNAPPFRPITSTPSAKLLEPGFSTTGTPASLLAAYSESDPRVSSTPNRWMRIELVALRHWGLADPGHVSLWRGGASPIVHWSTARPPLGGDVWFTIPGGHDHMDWAFSHAGIYELDLRASAFLNDASLTPTSSATVTLSAAVGPLPSPYAWWAKTHFSPAEWRQGLAAPSHLAAAPGLNNAAAFALGLPPRDPAVPLALRPGLGQTESGPTFRFTRPAPAPAGATIEIEHSSDLATWTTLARSVDGGAFEILAAGASIESSAPDPLTQRVTLSARAAAPGPRDFYRLRFWVE